MTEATAVDELPFRPSPARIFGDAAAPRMSRELQLRQAMAIVEVSTGEVTSCIQCGGPELGRWGTNRRGLQRWRCRACERSFTAVTGTLLARVHSLDKLRAVALDMLGDTPASCRKLAAALEIDRMTVWRWRQQIAAAWARSETNFDADCSRASAPGIVTLRESRKASREWVRHRQDPARYPAPDRLRWVDYRVLDLPLPEPMSRFRIDIRLDAPPCPSERDRCHSSGETPRPWPAECRRFGAHADHRRAATLYGHARDEACPPKSTAGRQQDAIDAFPLIGLFRQFIKPFCGPATRHLETYRTWFLVRTPGAFRC